MILIDFFSSGVAKKNILVVRPFSYTLTLFILIFGSLYLSSILNVSVINGKKL